MRKTKFVIYSLLLFPSFALAQLGEGVDSTKPPVNAEGKEVVPTNLWQEIDTITNLLLFLAGAVAVIVIIFGGFRYITSTGDPARVKQAKDTIVYGIIGLIVAILAYAIVRFITTQLK
mgnify:FL=1